MLVHFDPSMRLVLTFDASPYGIGAVLSHQMGMGRIDQLPFHLEHLPLLRETEKILTTLEREISYYHGSKEISPVFIYLVENLPYYLITDP